MAGNRQIAFELFVWSGIRTHVRFDPKHGFQDEEYKICESNNFEGLYKQSGDWPFRISLIICDDV